MKTNFGDIKLICYDNKPLCYARVEDIVPDAKPNWWQVKILILQVPSQIITWILRDTYIDGEDFTMDGKLVKLENLQPVKKNNFEKQTHKKDLEKRNSVNDEGKEENKIIDFFRKKKDL